MLYIYLYVIYITIYIIIIMIIIILLLLCVRLFPKLLHETRPLSIFALEIPPGVMLLRGDQELLGKGSHLPESSAEPREEWWLSPKIWVWVNTY